MGGTRRRLAALREPRLAGLVLLAVAICVSPRIRVPLSVGREFDLRFEDGILAILALAWMLRRPRVSLRQPVVVAFGAYLAVAVVSTLVAIALYGLPPLRGVAFWGKNVEFFLVFLFAWSWVRSARERVAVVAAVVALGVVNLAWLVVQATLTHSYHALLAIGPPIDRPGFSYGPGLVGEVSPESAGMFFLLQFLVWFAWFAQSRDRRRAWWRYAVAAAMLTGLVLVESRVAYLGSAVGAAVLAALNRRRWHLVAAYGAALGLGFGVLLALGGPQVGRVTNVRSVELSFEYRVEAIWRPVITKFTGSAGGPRAARSSSTPQPVGTAGPVASPTPERVGSLIVPDTSSPAARRPPALLQALLGYGNGGMGFYSGLNVEAHNMFLRVYLETGLPGLAAFLALLAALLRGLWLALRSSEAVSDRVVRSAALGLVVAFLPGALVQDVFFPVIPNELLWLMVGLALAVTAAKPAAGAPMPSGRG